MDEFSKYVDAFVEPLKRFWESGEVLFLLVTLVIALGMGIIVLILFHRHEKRIRQRLLKLYDEVGDTRNTRCPIAVRKGNLWLYVNKKGVPLNEERFEWADDFREGVATALKKGKFVHVDVKGKILKRQTYTSV